MTQLIGRFVILGNKTRLRRDLPSSGRKVRDLTLAVINILDAPLMLFDISTLWFRGRPFFSVILWSRLFLSP